jgi:hypothetical protein
MALSVARSWVSCLLFLQDYSKYYKYHETFEKREKGLVQKHSKRKRKLRKGKQEQKKV